MEYDRFMGDVLFPAIELQGRFTFDRRFEESENRGHYRIIKGVSRFDNFILEKWKP